MGGKVGKRTNFLTWTMFSSSLSHQIDGLYVAQLSPASRDHQLSRSGNFSTKHFYRSIKTEVFHSKRPQPYHSVGQFPVWQFRLRHDSLFIYYRLTIHLLSILLYPSASEENSCLSASRRAGYLCERVSKIGKKQFAEFFKFLAGSFSAVSKRNFARKYAFDSIFQALQD